MVEKDYGKYIVNFAEIPYERKVEERALYPISTLNYLTGGMELGEISIIAGETGSGKTTFVSQCVYEILKYNKCFCIYGESTLEKQAHAQYRQMTPYNDKDYTYITYNTPDGKETNVGMFFVSEKAERTIKAKTDKKLFYYDTRGGMDIDSIIGVIRYAYEKGGIRYFVLDNLMQVESMTSDEIRETKDNFERIRRFVIENKCHIAVLAHYRKTFDYSIFRRRLAEIAGTSAIGNKCATAINIIRLDTVDKTTKYSKSFAKLLEANGYNFDECDAVIEVLKTRFNKLGFVGLKYNHKTNTYYEAQRINDKMKEQEKSNVVAPPYEEITVRDDELPF